MWRATASTVPPQFTGALAAEMELEVSALLDALPPTVLLEGLRLLRRAKLEQ